MIGVHFCKTVNIVRKVIRSMFDFCEQLLLHAENLSPVVKGDSIWIKCPFHSNGQERTPSCRINLVKGKYPAGFFYCYGCGTHGDWNTLASAIPDLPTLDGFSKKEQEYNSLRRFTYTEKQEMLGDTSCLIDLSLSVPWNKDRSWRNIQGQVLSDIGSRLIYNEKTKETNLFLPCYQGDQLKGGIYAYLEKPNNRSCYVNSPGSWVKNTWFLYDYQKQRIRNNGIIAIVEGPRDALNFTQNGFPAIALLGSKNWSSTKSSLLQLLDPKLVVLALDPDQAGQSAFKEIEKNLRNCLSLLKINFKRDEDPGNLDPRKIKILYQKCLAYSHKCA